MDSWRCPRRSRPPQRVCDALRALLAELIQELLREHGVLPLLSLPGTPEYNGACEAGIGGLETRAHHVAARYGRPGEWTCDDVETARLIANETARPRGTLGPTPDEL